MELPDQVSPVVSVGVDEVTEVNMENILYGLIVSAIMTLYIRFTAEGKAFGAGLLISLSTFIGIYVVVDVINTGSLIGALQYCLGIGIGAYLAVKISKDNK